MSQEQKQQAVTNVLRQLQPAMEVDGGGIASFDIDDGNVVRLRFKGTCLFCPSQKLTLNLGIKPILIMALPWLKDVVAC